MSIVGVGYFSEPFTISSGSSLFETVCLEVHNKEWEATLMQFRRGFSVLMMIFELAIVAAAENSGAQGGASPQSGAQTAPVPQPFIMTLTAFADGTDIPAKYPQAGSQTSPA